MAEVDLAPLASLEYLDLSRNLIQEILPGTFMGMSNLKGLDFSVNVVRKVNFPNLYFLKQSTICLMSGQLKTYTTYELIPG